MSSDLDRIDAAILKVEGQIDACADPEERKLLRKKEEQLREERLILLRKTAGNVINMCSSFHPAKLFLILSLGFLRRNHSARVLPQLRLLLRIP
jgi:hypothetical protein